MYGHTDGRAVLEHSPVAFLILECYMNSNTNKEGAARRSGIQYLGH